MTATTPQAAAATREAPGPGFMATLASEWTKIASVRSSYITVGLGVLLAIGMNVLVMAIIGATYNDWAPSDQASFDPILTSFFGTIFSAILFAVFGVNVVASEYSSNMIRLTLTATPRRTRVLAAKLTLIALITLVAGLIAIIGSYLVAQAVFAAYDMTTVGLGEWDALRAVLATGVLSPLFPIIGASLAFVFRSTAAPITSVMAIIFAPAMFGGLLPRAWQENALAYLPGPASDSVAIGHLDPGAAMYLDTPLAAIVVVAWLAAFIGGAWLALTRRDA